MNRGQKQDTESGAYPTKHCFSPVLKHVKRRVFQRTGTFPSCCEKQQKDGVFYDMLFLTLEHQKYVFSTMYENSKNSARVEKNSVLHLLLPCCGYAH